MRAVKLFGSAAVAVLTAVLVLPTLAKAMPVKVTGTTINTGNMTWRAWDDAYKQLNESKNGGKVDYCNANNGKPLGDVIGDGKWYEFKGGWSPGDVYKLSPMTCGSTVAGQKVTWQCDISAKDGSVGSGHSTHNERRFYVKCGNRFTQKEFNLYYNKFKGLCEGSKCSNGSYFNTKLKAAIVSCQNNSKVDAGCVNNKLNGAGLGLKMDEANKATTEINKQIDDANKANESQDDDSNNKGNEAKANCQISGIGWLVCPAVDFMASSADGIYGIISGFLEVDSSMFDTNSASYIAYQSFLPIANIILAILFILIIYSEATGNGFGSLSNYTVKKMLPRLIIFAILVNISWWICAAAVDFSNILGANLKDFFSDTAQSAIGDMAYASPGWASTANLVLTGTIGTTTAVTAIGGAIAFHQLAPLMMVLLSVIITLLGVFLILVMRQAIVILLCVVAPVAFAAGLLPNTKPLFKKWLKFMLTLLMMYPLIAMIFGASAMASDVMIAQAGDDWAMQLAGQACRVLPLIVTPFAIISCFKGLGKFAAAATGFMVGRSSGMRGRAKKLAKDNRMNSNARRATTLRAKQGIGRGVVKMANKFGVRAPNGAYKLANEAAAFDNKHNNDLKDFAKQRLVASTSQDQQKQIAMDGTYTDNKGNVQQVDASTRQAAIDLQWGKMSGAEQDTTLHNIAEMGAETRSDTPANPSDRSSTMVQGRQSTNDRQDYQKVAGEVLSKIASGKSNASLSLADANDMLSGVFDKVDSMGQHAIDYNQVAGAHERYIASRSQQDLQGASVSNVKGWYRAVDDALARGGASGQALHDETVRRVNSAMSGSATSYINQQAHGRVDRASADVHNIYEAATNGGDVKYD